jgi:hypothetical protein
LPVDRDNHGLDCTRYIVAHVHAQAGGMDDADLASFLLSTDWGTATLDDD